MFDDIREKWAYRRALKAVKKRRVKAWPTTERQRRVLVVMPAEGDNVRELWRFVSSIDVPADQICVVSTTANVADCPAPFIGHVRVLDESDMGMLGLAKRAVYDSVWQQGANVAIDLHRAPTLATMHLVGASSASFRVGFYQEAAEPFFDVMFNPAAEQPVSAVHMRSYLQQITPPILPFVD